VSYKTVITIESEDRGYIEEALDRIKAAVKDGASGEEFKRNHKGDYSTKTLYSYELTVTSD
jgi:hypothetical protein